MSNYNFDLEFACSSCNCNPGCFSWLQPPNQPDRSGSLLVFGSGCFLALAEVRPDADSPPRVLSYASNHTGLVTNLRRARSCSSLTSSHTSTSPSPTLFVSTSADKSACVWELVVERVGRPRLELLAQLLAHSDSVTAADSLLLGVGTDAFLIICTISIDSTLRIWKITIGKPSPSGAIQTPKCEQSFSFGNGFALDVSFFTFCNENNASDSSIFLACTTDDNRIRFYSITMDSTITVSSLFSLETWHTDWIRSVRMLPSAADQLLMLSASQDQSIRIWTLNLRRASNVSSTAQSSLSTEKLQLGSQRFAVCAGGDELEVRLEALLLGHSDQVLSAEWCSTRSLISCAADGCLIVWELDEEARLWLESARLGRVGGEHVPLGFLSCAPSSTDPFCLSPSQSQAVGVGVEAMPMPILAVNDMQGALLFWQQRDLQWTAIGSLSGPLGGVADVDWEPDGRYLVAVSPDYSARLYSQVQVPRATATALQWAEVARPQAHGYGVQCVASLGALSFVSAAADEHVLRAFSATRAFLDNFAVLTGSPLRSPPDASRHLAEGATLTALSLSNTPLALGGKHDDVSEVSAVSEVVPNSNSNSSKQSKKQKKKNRDAGALELDDDADADTAVGAERARTSKEDALLASGALPLGASSVARYGSVPLEDQLVQATVWPEYSKLYGHANEVCALAVNAARTRLASASTGSQRSQAAIFLWRVSPGFGSSDSAHTHTSSLGVLYQFELVQRLEFHQLSVTQLAFSPSGRFLLSVSRDRNWALFADADGAGEQQQQQQQQPSGGFALAASSSALSGGVRSPHQRVLWSCDWAASDQHFATVSRDRVLAVWRVADVLENAGTSSAPNAVDVRLVAHTHVGERDVDVPSAVALCPCEASSSAPVVPLFLVLGFESGRLDLFRLEHTFDGNASNLLLVHTIDRGLSVDSGARIARLKFRPKRVVSGPVNLDADHSSSNSTLLALAGERGLLFYRFVLPSVQ